MADKVYYLGTLGPFHYDDAVDRPDGTPVKGLETDGTVKSDVVETNTLMVVGSSPARKLVEDDAGSLLAEISDLGFFVKGTAGQITVTDNTDGTVTISILLGAAVLDPAALTAIAVDPGTVTLPDLATEYNALRGDVIAVRSAVVALLAELRGRVITV